MKMKQGVPKRRRIKFRSRGITQKKAYNKSFRFIGIPVFLCEQKLTISSFHFLDKAMLVSNETFFVAVRFCHLLYLWSPIFWAFACEIRS